MFKVEEWLKQQDSIVIFKITHQGEEIEAKLMPLDPVHVGAFMQLTDREQAIKYASNYGLIVGGERYVEQGSLQNLENLWQLARLPANYREQLADKVCEITGLDLPEPEPLAEDELDDVVYPEADDE